jgi:hypothetical protein
MSAATEEAEFAWTFWMSYDPEAALRFGDRTNFDKFAARLQKRALQRNWDGPRDNHVTQVARFRDHTLRHRLMLLFNSARTNRPISKSARAGSDLAQPRQTSVKNVCLCGVARR